MRKFFGAVALALFVPAVLTAAPEDGAEKPAKADSIVGEYKIVAGEKAGEAIPKERLKDNGVVITEDTFAVIDRDKKELYAARYKLSKQEGEEGAWRIDLVSTTPREGDRATGLVKREGEEVWLVYGIGANRPEGFEKTKEGQHLFKMKRTAEEAKPGGQAVGAE